jgi:phosphatidate cytidylyltransferase
MIWPRVFTAILLITFVIGCLFFTSAPLFDLLSAGLFVIAHYEWTGLCQMSSWLWRGVLSVLFGVCLLGLFVLSPAYYPFLFLGALGLWILLLYWTSVHRGTFPWLLRNPTSRLLIGYVVLGIAWFGLHLIRAHDKGSQWILCLLVIVCSSDTAAYFVGRAWGKRLFAPLISPKKTWAGFWGGLVGAFTVALGCFWWMDLSRSQLPYFIIMSLILIMLAIYGDLFESCVKRVANKKDSGNLLPGHGGVLDRIDSLLPTLPFFAWYLTGI